MLTLSPLWVIGGAKEISLRVPESFLEALRLPPGY
jgi:hypothetical protein